MQSCYSQNESKHKILNGKWLVEFNSNDIGVVRTFLDFEFEDTTFIAYSRQDADRDILSNWKSFLGRNFTKNFKNGSLINITNGKVKQKGDTTEVAGIFRSALGSYYFRGKIHKGLLDVKLTNGKNEEKGTIKGSKTIPTLPLSNYPAIIDKALALTKENIFRKKLVQSKDYITFEKDIKRVANKMQDDLEMEFAFFYYAGKLPISHYSLLRLPNEEDSTEEGVAEKQITLLEKSPETMYMKINSFSGSAAEVDTAFAIINRGNYNNLIVDLRNNTGGSVEAGMKFATCVADTEFYGGVFLTQKWFDKNNTIPDIKDYNKLTLFSKANFDLIIEGIHNEQGLCLKIIPEPTTYKGKLFILTNGSTASTCEPIVYGLKQYKRAIIVGEKTSGAMLNGEFFKIADDYSIVIPTADYYTSDGYRIDQKGVIPTITIKQETALDYVLQNLIKK